MSDPNEALISDGTSWSDEEAKHNNALERAKDAINAAWRNGYRAGVAEGRRSGIEAMRRAWEEHEGDYHSPKLHAEHLLKEAEK